MGIILGFRFVWRGFLWKMGVVLGGMWVWKEVWILEKVQKYRWTAVQDIRIQQLINMIYCIGILFYVWMWK